jgi:isoquinoline 1-oxidoreductase alpha subunit
MIMAVSALLATNPAPTDDELAAAITNICRCGTFPRIRSAVRDLATRKAAGGRG